MAEDHIPPPRSYYLDWRHINGLKKEEADEIVLFSENHQLKLDDEARHEAFRSDIQRRMLLFEEFERQTTRKRFLQFTKELMDTGIDRVRKNTIPPYSFQMFTQLPAEIQLRIWSMAARAEEPRVHCFVSIQKDAQVTGTPGHHIYQHKGSSRIYGGPLFQGFPQNLPLSVLSTSKDSRKIAQTVYTLLPYSFARTTDLRAKTYYNTLYDSFYLGGSAWDEFKILVDLLIKLNTSRPMQEVVQRDLGHLLKIRNLIVDMTVFGGTPARVWAEFPQLEVLTIVFYPRPDITNHDFENERYELVCNPQFINPRRGSKFGKRADWILVSATKTLQELRKEVPQWQMPKIKVVIRTCGLFELDKEIEEEWDEEDDEEDEEEYQEEDEDDDSLWYQQAAMRISCKITAQHIKELKHKHHLGVKKLSGENNPNDETWLSDSEGEEGLAAYKKYASGIVYEDSDDD